MSDSSNQSSAPRLVNLSELPIEWQWLREPFLAHLPDWHHVSTQSMRRRGTPLGHWEARWRAAVEASRLLAGHRGPNILVSHGPRPATYWGWFGRGALDAHDVYSFNFTELPTGIKRRAAARAFRNVTRFVVSSTWERELYAEYFDIPLSRIVFKHWGVQAPAVAADAPRLIEAPYVCALGSQARDYATLAEAMRRLPHLRLAIVATPDSVRGVRMPDNVELHVNIPYAKAMQLLQHSELMVLPMNDVHARCGHVTAVSALHLGVPMVSTDCRGLDDYLRPDETAVVTPQGQPDELAKAIDALVADDARRKRLGQQGQAFARTLCTEAAVIDAFRSSLIERGLLGA
jgi:glycosyltransferase involved in cell wall biosynthesis